MAKPIKKTANRSMVPNGNTEYIVSENLLEACAHGCRATEAERLA